MKKVLISGATGYVGSQLAIHFLRMGVEVHIVTRPESDTSALQEVVSELRVHKHDGSTEDLIGIMREVAPDVVFHLASLFLAQHQSKDIAGLITSNVLFSTQLLEAMVMTGVKRIVNTGTSWQHFKNEARRPVNLYAATKQAFEDILDYYSDAQDIQAITLVLFDTYGPNDPRKKLISLLSESQVSQKPLPMSPGQQMLDLVHIDDVIDAFFKAGERLLTVKLRHERYGVSSGRPMQLKELVSEFEIATGSNVPVLWGERSYRPREVMTTWTDYQQLPEWQPKRDFFKEIAKTNPIGKEL